MVAAFLPLHGAAHVGKMEPPINCHRVDPAHKDARPLRPLEKIHGLGRGPRLVEALYPVEHPAPEQHGAGHEPVIGFASHGDPLPFRLRNLGRHEILRPRQDDAGIAVFLKDRQQTLEGAGPQAVVMVEKEDAEPRRPATPRLRDAESPE